MLTKANILGVNVDTLTMRQSVQKVLDYTNENRNHLIFTPNPEVIMEANKNKKLMNILNHADLVVPDGIGVVIASKVLNKPIPERVAGYDLVQQIFSKIKNTDKTVYFLGAAPGITDIAAKKMRAAYKGLKIIGVRNGYFNEADEQDIITEINTLEPDIVLAGLGAPKQEIFLHQYKDKLKAKVCIGVGGSFDVMAGKLKRAPKIFQKLGLEWFHRLITQPKRAVRMLQLPLFMLKVFKVKLTNG